MWIVNYEAHFKYAKSYKKEMSFKYYIVARTVYFIFRLRYAMSIMPIRCISLYKIQENILVPKYLECNDFKSYRRLKHKKSR